MTLTFTKFGASNLDSTTTALFFPSCWQKPRHMWPCPYQLANELHLVWVHRRKWITKSKACLFSQLLWFGAFSRCILGKSRTYHILNPLAILNLRIFPFSRIHIQRVNLRRVFGRNEKRNWYAFSFLELTYSWPTKNRSRPVSGELDAMQRGQWASIWEDFHCTT